MKGFSRPWAALAWAGLLTAVLVVFYRGEHKVASFQATVVQFSHFLEAREPDRARRKGIHAMFKKISEQAKRGGIPESTIDRFQEDFSRAIQDDALDSLEISALLGELEGLPLPEGR